jgi:hypothetical protein
MNPFVDQHQEEVGCVLSCFDRVVITGTLPDICHARAMAGYLGARGIRLFDYAHWAEPLRDEIRANAEHVAAEAGLEIEFIRKLKAFRKEDRIAEILSQRGDHPGLVHIFSAMETCPSYRPWYDKASGKTLFKPITGKCLHYYFYFVDEQFGLCYVRVPTWAPFRLQVYFNGHGWLARQLTRAGIAFETADNAFLPIADPAEAQRLADSLDATTLHRHLDEWARRFCPVLNHFRNGVHWSFLQVEYATDVVFQKQATFQPLYEAIVRTAVHVIKAEHVASFLGHKLSASYQGEVGNDFSTRIQGTRIRHHMGPASIKLYALRRPDRTRGVHRQRCHLLQAPPLCGTAQRRTCLQARPTAQIDLLPSRSSATHARRKRPLLRLHGLPRQPQRRAQGVGQNGRTGQGQGPLLPWLRPVSRPRLPTVPAHGASCVKGIPDSFCRVGNAVS